MSIPTTSSTTISSTACSNPHPFLLFRAHRLSVGAIFCTPAKLVHHGFLWDEKFRSSLFKGLRIPKAAPLVADRSRRNSGQYRTIAAHALLESYSVSLHINPLTCVSKSAVFLCNLTKNLTSQSAHPNLCGVALTTESAGGESKQSGGLFWRGEPSPGVPRCEAQIPQFSVRIEMFGTVSLYRKDRKMSNKKNRQE